MSETLKQLFTGSPQEVRPPSPKVEYAEILRQCADIAEERGEKYGEVLKNFYDIQQIMLAMYGIQVSLEDIARIFIATKVSREKHAHQEDNILDQINYNAILLYLQRESKRSPWKKTKVTVEPE